MNKLGLNYGPAFQGLTEISACPNRPTAVASVVDKRGATDAMYQIHPTIIDSCLRLFTVAATKDAGRRLRKLCIPIEVEEIYIRQGTPKLQVKAIGSSLANGVIKGDIVAAEGDAIVMHLRGGRSSPLEDHITTDVTDTVAGAQLEWKAAIDFLPTETLTLPCADANDEVLKLEKLALLCMLEVPHQLSQAETKVQHLKKYQR